MDGLYQRFASKEKCSNRKVNVKALDIYSKGVLAATGNDKRKRVLNYTLKFGILDFLYLPLLLNCIHVLFN
jgi:hypothetical protein